MSLTPSRLALLAAGLLLSIVGSLPAQPPPPRQQPGGGPDPTDYRRFFKKPTTPQEFWEAAQFEIDVGRHDLAARHLSGLLAFPGLKDEDLVKIHDRVGMAKFLKLRLIRKWDDDKARNTQAFKDIETLIDKVSAAVRAKLNDPKRITDFIKNLSGSPEEHSFAVRELFRSGPAVMPYLIDEVRAVKGHKREPLLRALKELSSDTVPALLAALDIDDAELRVDLIWALRNRQDFILLPQKGVDPAPFLWPLAAPTQTSATVRQHAREALAKLLNVGSPDSLPFAKEMLTREAEKYFLHKINFPDPQRVVVWRWDAKTNKLVEDRTFTPSTAEEYFGLRFSRQALEIDPAFRPAQILFLSLAVEKGHGPPTPEAPLGVLKPSASETLNSSNPDLINAVLELALREKRTPLALEAIRALAAVAEKRSNQPTAKGSAALVKALNYGDRRVQMAAADALLRIPGPPAEGSPARVVEVLRRALAPEAAVRLRQRLLIGIVDVKQRNDAARVVEEAGLDTVLVSNGRDLLRRLNEGADIDGILFESTLPGPGLASLLAQLASDVNYKRLPVLLAAVPESKETRLIREEMAQLLLNLTAIESAPLPKRETNPFLQSEVSQKELEIRDDRHTIARRELLARLQARRKQLQDEYLVEARAREESLRRFVERYPQVQVLPAVMLSDGAELKALLDQGQQAATNPPLSPAEQKAHSEKALHWLARMARGEPLGEDRRPAYDFRPATRAVMDALPSLAVSPEAMTDALRIVGRTNDVRAQSELIAFTLDTKRPAPLRVVAAEELARHIQEFGRPATAQAKVLQDGIQLQLRGTVDPALRPKLVSLLGSLRPDAPTTGERLKGYTP